MKTKIAMLSIITFLCVCLTALPQTSLRDIYITLGPSGTLLTGSQGNSGIVQQSGTIGGATGAPLCTDSGGNDTTSGCSTQSVKGFTNTTLGSDVVVSANTVTTVLSQSITMPSTGCPCRVFMSYSVWLNTITNGTGYTLWVTDGTNTMLPYSTGQSNAASGGATGASMSGFSTVTYANSANVTFTLTTEGTLNYTVKATQIGSGSPPNSGIQFSVLQSN